MHHAFTHASHFLGHIILSYEYMIFFVYFEHTGVGTSLGHWTLRYLGMV
jgi:hypothetical protein